MGALEGSWADYLSRLRSYLNCGVELSHRADRQAARRPSFSANSRRVPEMGVRGDWLEPERLRHSSSMDVGARGADAADADLHGRRERVSRSRMPPAALTWTAGGECLSMQFEVVARLRRWARSRWRS